MTDQLKQVGAGRKMFGDFAPKLADDVLFEDVWNRPQLPARARSLITVAVLTAGGNTASSDSISDAPSRTASPRRSSSRPSPT
jgi:alkylhydroperoxidase/carboxymuconolactone decarboxylase family protein YurZ